MGSAAPEGRGDRGNHATPKQPAARAGYAGEVAPPARGRLESTLRDGAGAASDGVSIGRHRAGRARSEVLWVHRSAGGADRAFSAARVEADSVTLRLRGGAAVASRGERETSARSAREPR